MSYSSKRFLSTDVCVLARTAANHTNYVDVFWIHRFLVEVLSHRVCAAIRSKSLLLTVCLPIIYLPLVRILHL